jgi:hypothetical protein
MLSKILFPLYVAAPVWLRRKQLLPHLKPALLVAVPLAATWYAFNFPYVLGFAWSAGFGRIAADYSTNGGIAARFASFASALGGGALSWPLTAAGALVAAASARRGPLDDGTRLAFAWAAPLAVFALGVNREIRYVAPVLPALCLLVARAAMSFDTRRARAASSILLLATGTFVFARETFVLSRNDALPWCGAPSSDPGWDRAALVAAAGEGGATVAAVALEHPGLNANNLASLAASRGLELRFISLGYAQTSADNALIRLKDKDADRLILIGGAPMGALPEFLNRANAGVASAVASGRLPARLRSRIAIGGGVEATVYALGRGM